MAADSILCNKPCALQNADKSYSEGTLYVFKSRIRFVARGGAAQKLEIAVEDIKGQKRSVKNPLLMLEAGSVRPVFKFQQQQERDELCAAITHAQEAQRAAAEQAELAAAAPAVRAGTPAAGAAAAAAGQGLSQLTPKVTSDERRALLGANKQLSDQYKKLVLEQKALTEDEFWSSSAMLKVAGVAGKPSHTARSSRRGLANKIVDLARQFGSSGDNRMATLKLTADDERQLLAEKPALKQIYDTQVGYVVSKEEFWVRYFKYYMSKHKKRSGSLKRLKAIQENLMADSAAAVAGMAGEKPDESADFELAAMFATLENPTALDDPARKALKRRLNPVVDLAAAAEDRLTADGYGLAHNSARSELEQVQGYSALSQQLAQDYNVHADTVMGHASSARTASAQAGSSKAAAAAGQPASEMSDEDRQRFRQQAGSGLDDLSTPVQQQFEELSVTNPRLYFSHIQQQQQPSLQQGKGQQPQGLTVKHEQQGSQQQPQQPQDVVRLLRGIDPNALTDQPMEPTVAGKVLDELCGGDVADAVRAGGTHGLPEPTKAALQQETMLVDELLRHFWGLIPCNSDEKKAKIARIQQALVQRGEVLKEHEDRCAPQQKVSLSRLIRPLWAQLDMATKAYNAIQTASKKQMQQQRAQAR